MLTRAFFQRESLLDTQPGIYRKREYVRMQKKEYQNLACRIRNTQGCNNRHVQNLAFLATDARYTPMYHITEEERLERPPPPLPIMQSTRQKSADYGSISQLMITRILTLPLPRPDYWVSRRRHWFIPVHVCGAVHPTQCQTHTPDKCTSLPDE